MRVRIRKNACHRHHLSRKKPKIRKNIHISIRPAPNALPIQNKSHQRDNKPHSILNNNTGADGYNYQSTILLTNQRLIKHRRNPEIFHVTKSKQYPHLTSQSIRKAHTKNRINPSVSECSQRTKIRQMRQTLVEATAPGRGSAKVIPHDVFIDNGNHTKRQNAWLTNVEGTENHHRNVRNKKKCTKKWMLVCAVIAVTVISVLLAILLPLLLVKATTTTTNYNQTPVLRWNATGVTIIGTTGQPGNNPSQLNNPWDLALDQSNTLYITDLGNHRVQKVFMGTSNGVTVAGFGNGTSGPSLYNLSSPLGIVIDDNNDNIYVADYTKHRVFVIPNGTLPASLFAGNGTAGSSYSQLSSPYGLALDQNSGAVYVAEYGNNRVMRFFPNNSTGSLVAGGHGNGHSSSQLSLPHAVHLDLFSNSLLIANMGANNIVRWTLGASNWTLLAGDINGTSGASSMRLNSPTDVTLDPMGNMYVVDRYNHRIQFFATDQSDGTTIAGRTSMAGINATLLNTPTSLILDNQLNLYVTDRINHRVQKFLRY